MDKDYGTIDLFRVKKGCQYKAKTVISYALLTILALGFILPFVWMISTSLKPDNEIFSLKISLIPSHFVWENYKTAWGFLPFGKFYFNSLFVGISATILTVLTSSMAAYAFGRIKFPGRDGLFLLYLGTLMIPFQVTMIPLYMILNSLKWLNTYFALIIPGAFTASGTFMLRQFFMSIPVEYEEAAFLEGCSRFGSYVKIIMPLAKPALITLLVFTFIGNWNNFLFPLIVIDNEALKTLPLGLAMFTGQHSTSWNLMMAAATFCIIPPVIIFTFFQKYIVEGITITGMGGR
jgi:multiple sugar transport system permease protein